MKIGIALPSENDINVTECGADFKIPLQRLLNDVLFDSKSKKIVHNFLTQTLAQRWSSVQRMNICSAEKKRKNTASLKKPQPILQKMENLFVVCIIHFIIISA